MDYKRIYKQLITKAKSELRQKSKEVYLESHHIIPTFMFKESSRNKTGFNKGHIEGNCNDSKNKVLLTPREHFLAHVLLYKMHTGSRYEYSCGASLMLFFNVANSKHTRVKYGGFMPLCKKYETYRLIGISSISKNNKGKYPMRDAATDEIVGSFDKEHENVLNGKWVHHSKGRHKYHNSITGESLWCKVDDVRLTTECGWNSSHAPMDGEKNTRFSGISNEQLLKTYTWISIRLKTIPSFSIYRTWYKQEFGIEFPKTLSVFRFNKGKELWSKIEELTGFKRDASLRLKNKINLEDYKYAENN